MIDRDPVGGDFVRLVESNETYRVKSSDRRAKTVTVFVPTDVDDDGDMMFDVRTLTWAAVVRVER